MGKTYVVLGGGGSFGIHTAMYLLEQDSTDKVVGIGRRELRPEPFSLGIDRLGEYEYHAYHIWHERDLLMKLLDRIKPDTIINFAAQGEGAVSWENSWRYFETNAVALSWLYEELQPRGYPEKFIHIGTSEMYGSVRLPAREDAPIKPTSPYAASKVAFDMYLQAMSQPRGQVGNLPVTILRPSNAYCPGQLLHRVIPKAIWCGLTGNKLPLHGGGVAEKSYIHARDLARAILMVDDSSAAIGKTYNVGPLNPTSIREVVSLCAVAMDMTFDELAEMADERPGQDSKYWLDSSAIKRDVGWEPEIGWQEGLSEMVEWGERYLDQIKDWPTDYIMRA